MDDSTETRKTSVPKDIHHDDTAALRRHGRRQFMFGAAAAGVGLAAGLVAEADPADAADGGNLKLGQANTASATTTLTGSTGTAFLGRNTAAKGIGIEGIDASPAGNGYGVFGQSPEGYGVYGTSTAGSGVYGSSGGHFTAGVMAEASGAGGSGSVPRPRGQAVSASASLEKTSMIPTATASTPTR